MTEICREVRRRIQTGEALPADLGHVDSCHACEMWLQEHINFRSLTLSPPASLENRLIPPTCGTTLRVYCGDDGEVTPATPCRSCKRTIEAMEALCAYLSTPRLPSQTLKHRLVKIARPRVTPLLRIAQIAAALLLATLITLAVSPTPHSSLEADRGRIQKYITIEMAFVKATFYKYYGKARGHLATTLARVEPDKEETNEMPVSSE